MHRLIDKQQFGSMFENGMVRANQFYKLAFVDPSIVFCDRLIQRVYVVKSQHTAENIDGITKQLQE